MRRQMRKWIAVGIAAIMILQTAHIENYGYIREVYASQVESAVDNTEELDDTDGITTEAGSTESTGDTELLEETLQTPMDSEYVQELYSENGVLEGDITIYPPSILNCDLTVNGNITLHNDLNLNGHTLTVNGNLEQYYDLSLNGSLVVNGDYNWKAGTINFNQGSLFVYQNMNIGTGSSITWNMEQEESYLFVGGNLILPYDNRLTTNITSGIIELQGDFIQNIYFDSYSMKTSTYDFVASGTNKLLLSGNHQQTIYISKETSGFRSVEVSTLNRETEETGVYDFGEQVVSFSKYCNYESYESHSCPTNYGYTEIEPGTLTEKNYVYGNGYLKSGILDLDTYTLYVQGSLIQNGDICLGTGTLCVLGDYRIQSAVSTPEEITYSTTSAVVDSTKNCEVYVEGDFITESVSDQTGLLTNGTWHFYGDITQIGEENQNFATGENWSGRIETYNVKGNNRTIHMDNPVGNPVNQLSLYAMGGTLLIDNGIYFNQNFGYAGMTVDGIMYIDNQNVDIFGSVTSSGGSLVTCGKVDFGSRNINTIADVLITDDITIDGGNLFCGNLIIQDGILTIKNGCVRANDITFADGGTGSLCMQDENAKLYCGDLYMGSNMVSGVLSDGEIHVSGNLTQKNGGEPNNLVTSGQMDVILEGSSGVQVIHFDSPESELENVYIRNTGSGCVVFDTEVTIHNLYDESHTLRENGLVGYTLDRDMVYTESVQLCGRVLDLNGHTLTIEKDFLLSAGTLQLNGGTLIVKGDFRCQDMYMEDGQEVYGPTNGSIIMNQDTDRIQMEKNWYIQIKDSSFSDMKAGDIYLAGNMTILNNSNVYNNVGKKMIGGANLFLNGSNPQAIGWEGEAVTLYVHDFCLDNPADVSSSAVCYVNGVISNIQDGGITFKSVHVNHIEDIVCERLEGDVYVDGAGILQHDLTVKGSLTNSGTIKLAGYTIQADNIYMQNLIYMEQPEDTIYVTDLYVDVKSNTDGYMTDGTIYVGGSFRDTTGSEYSFLPSGNHTMVFERQEEGGEEKITFYNSTSKLNIAVIKGKLNYYSLNRNKEEIANELILDYEDGEKPEPPEEFACIDVTCRTISLSWAEAYDNMEIEKYILYRDGVRIGETKRTAYIDIALDSDTVYRYEVEAQDAKGNLSNKTELSVVTVADETAPYIQREPEITASDTEIILDCSESFIDDESYVDYYVITRDGVELGRVKEKAYFSYKNLNGGTSEWCVHDGSPVYTDTTVEKRKIYQYGVYAVDMAGNYSTEYQIEVAADPLPEAPKDFLLETENGHNYISFEKSGLRECSSYYIYRKTGASGNYKLIAKIENDIQGYVNYEDESVTDEVRYYYYIQPFNADGEEGEKTEELSIITSKDTIPPEIIDIRYQIEGDIINENLQFIVSAKDNGKVEDISAYYVKTGEEEQNSIARKEFVTTGKTASAKFLLKTDELLGNYTIHIVATDQSGTCAEKEKQIQVNCAGLSPVTVLDASATADAVTLEWEPLTDALSYQVEMIYGSSYVYCGKTTETHMTINNLRNNSVYQFRVAAYDENQVKGRSSDIVTIETGDDIEKPVIVTVNPDGMVYTEKTPLYLSYKDNVEVNKITAFYRKEGGETWETAGETYGCGARGSVNIIWDKTALESGSYEVKFQIEDASGNQSEEVIRHYILDKDAPEIKGLSLIPKDWEIEVQWNSFSETDYDRCKLYRINADATETLLAADRDITFFKEQISPKEEYTYRLYAWDVYGNMSYAEISGTSIDNDIFEPEVCDIADMFAAMGNTIKLSAPGCSDNDGIKSYTWDMGNGDVIQGENCNYVYQIPGDYTASVTVEDNSGNTAIKTFNITVGMNIGVLNVTVQCQNKVLEKADVVVCMNGKPYHSGLSPQTNVDGVLQYPVSAGTYKIAAYKDGYMPKEVTVTVDEGETKDVTIFLEKNDFIDASVTSEQMSYEEMIQEGIDPEKNKAVYNYTLQLKYEILDIPAIEFDNRDEKTEWHWEVPVYAVNDEKKEEISRKRIDVENVSEDPAQPVFVVTQTEKVSISWLANVYKVSITICNNASESFGLEDTTVSLDLPDGLQLAEMKKSKENDKIWEIGDMEGGTSETHSWYISGQKAGTYNIGVSLEAYFPAFERKISYMMIAEKAVTVTVGKGLHLYIYPENYAYIGEMYYIQYKLKNESNETYYNISTNFGNYESPDYVIEGITLCKYEEDGREEAESERVNLPVKLYIPNMDGTDKKVIMVDDNTMLIEELKPGEAIYGTSVQRFNAAGNQYEEYYRLINNYAEEINSNNTNVTVSVQLFGSHITKNVQKKFIHKKSDYTVTEGKKEDDDDDENTTPYPKDSTQSVKDPINLMTGAFTSNHILASAAGADTMNFQLAYNSLSTGETGEVGRGWYHNYEMRLERMGSIVILYLNPGERMCFAESEETANVLSGTVDGNVITFKEDSFIERTYYQTGTDSRKYRIQKNKDGYILSVGTETYRFDPMGTLVEYVNESGQSITVQKTEEKLVISDSATGKTITAVYDKDGKIIKVTDPAGNSATLVYENGNLSKLTGKNGTTLCYMYDEEGHIIKGMEGDGFVFVENTYDTEGRVLTQVSNEKKEEITKFTYVKDSETENLEVTMTNADGTTEKAVSDRYGQGLRYENSIGGVTTYEYNENCDMTAYRAPDGTGESYTYDENGNITSVTETTGKSYQYTYDEANRVIRVTGNDGMDIRYTYNEKGQKKEVFSSNGLKAVYTYNEAGQVLTEQSGLGTMTYHYDKGMLTSLEDYSGNTHSFVYDTNGNVIQYTDGRGVVTDYEIDPSGRILSETVNMEDGSKATVSYSYDAFGNLLSKTDAMGNATSYVYNDEDRISEETRPDGSIIRYTYDVDGNLTKVIYPDGETTLEAVYDAAGNTLSLMDTLKSICTGSYSAGSQLLSMEQSNGGVVKYTYYDNGLLESQTDANGNILTIRYDDAGRVIQTADAEDNTTEYGYDKDGNLCKIEDALGNSTEMRYNEFRKVISRKDPNGNVTTYDYDKALNCIRVTDAEQGVTEFAYDANGQITSMTKKGETKEQDITLSMTYDNLGNVTSVTDGEGNVHRMEYDLNSNLTAVYDAKGVKTASYTYDKLGNQKTMTDAFGSVTENTYDCFGNMIKQMNEASGEVNTYSYLGGKYLAGSTDALDNTASMTYDSMGNVATITNPNGGVTTYQYDLNNNLTDEIIGEDYHVRYTYNAWNLAASKTNSRDQQTTYIYDALGRLVHQEDEAGIIDYTYDANGNVLTVTETTGAAVNTITRTYDGLNRITSYEDGKGNKIRYEYDKSGNLVKLTYPNGKAVIYTYDKNCNIKTVTDWKNRTTVYSYDANGRLVKTERPNGTVETRGYDKAGQLILILDKCGDTEVNRQEYSYDAAGNITEVKQLYNGELDFTGVATASMTYDENNRLMTYNGEKVAYDKDGNMTYGPLQGRMTEFVFDCRNRLIKAGDTSYEYDAENNRIAAATGTKRTEYVVDSQPELSRVLQSTVTDGEREETTCYFYGKGLASQENVTGGYLTYHFNNVGSTMAVTDENGAVRCSYHYSPYGELLEGEYSENIPFLYNGQAGVATDENGLYYMRARYYNVDIKRFVNQDVLTGTLERISSLNRYAYVEGNPVSYLDPFGLAKSIYDEWHEYLQEMQNFYTYLSASAFALYYKIPIAGEVVSTAIGIDSILVACMDFGVCIGRAWEGIYENNYDKVDSSYNMMWEIIQSLCLTLTTMAMDSLYDKPVFGFINDLIGIIEDLERKN